MFSSPSAMTALWHNCDVIMGAITSQITCLTIVYSTVYSDADQRKHQSSASLAFVRGIHRGPVNSLHKWPVTWKMFPFDDVIVEWKCSLHHKMAVMWPLVDFIVVGLNKLLNKYSSYQWFERQCHPCDIIVIKHNMMHSMIMTIITS